MIHALILAALLAPVSKVPEGGYVLVNGLLDLGEWAAAGTVALDAETELRAQRDSRSLFLAVAFKGPRHTGLDLYLESRGQVRMLHVSSALGERALRDGQWTEMTWGENRWWAANVIGLVSEGGKQRILEPEAFELQVDRAELGPEVKLYFHLKRPDKRLPAGASQEATNRWLRLALE